MKPKANLRLVRVDPSARHPAMSRLEVEPVRSQHLLDCVGRKRADGLPCRKIGHPGEGRSRSARIRHGAILLPNAPDARHQRGCRRRYGEDRPPMFSGRRSPVGG